MIVSHKKVCEPVNKVNPPPSRKFCWAIVSLFVVGLMLLLLLLMNMHNFRDKAFELGFNAINQESIGAAIKRIPVSYVKAKFKYPDVPTIQIDIKFKHFKKLQEKRNTAIAAGKIVQKEDDYVPAKVQLNGKTVKVKLRIKGDNIDHLIGDKWSFRIKTSGKKALFGMRRFSIQNPYVRGFQGQYLIDETRRIYGLVSLRRKLVNVVVNGNRIGLMEVEEHFSKELLESNGRKESVIIRFDESDSWEFGRLYDYTNTMVDPFRQGRINQSQTLQQHNRMAIGLLRGYSDGVLAASDAFEVSEMGMFLAINRLWGSQHGVRWGNLRFYFNPYIGKLQPIGYDDNFHERRQYNVPIKDKFFTKVLQDKLVYQAYLTALRKLTQDVLKGNLISQLNDLEKQYATPLFTEFYLLQRYNYSDLKKRAKWISENIVTAVAETLDYSSIRNAHIYLVKRNLRASYDLQFSSAIPEDIIVKGVKHLDPLKDAKLKSFFSNYLPLNLKGKKINEQKFYKVISDVPFESIEYAKFSITSIDNNYVTEQEVELYYPALDEPVMLKDKGLKDLLKRGVISIDHHENILIFNKGKWEITETVSISSYKKVVFSPGVVLNFKGGVGIVSQVPINIDGQSEKIQFLGDGKGGWLYLADVQGKSFINGLIMKNVAAVDFEGVKLTGALSIYKSDINIKGISIDTVKSEDALNIISSNFSLSDCSISNTDSDAIDTDFSKGVISHCKFHNIGILGGGDAIDLSGSHVKIEQSEIKMISDKAISSGEKSNVEVNHVHIYGSSIGIASKDGSTTKVVDSSISNSGYAAMMAYVKKKEYGGASIISLNTDIDKPEMVMSDKLSTILIDGDAVKQSDINTKQLYKTIMKSSRK